jgi:5-formyltetrahydrofolate cyclo-ligase
LTAPAQDFAALSKQELRRTYRHLRACLDPAQRAAASQKITEHLLHHLEALLQRPEALQVDGASLPIPPACSPPGGLSGAVVGLYASTAQEVHTEALAFGLAARGLRCAYPRQCGEGLEFAMPEDATSWALGPRGIREPIGSAVALKGLSLIVTPGLAFDLQGVRLGYGGGFYDRAMAGYTGLRIGLAFHVCLAPGLPAAAHDVPVHAVVTERGFFPTNTKGDLCPQ